MTIWDLLARAGRRWYVVLACLAITIVTLTVVTSTPPVYSSRTQVVLLSPDPVSNPYVSNTASTVALAGTVERAVNGRGDGSQAASDTVTLVGTGVRDGTTIWIPNKGGQWSYNFSEPVINVEVAAESRESAALRMQAALALVFSTIDRLQDEQGVPADVRVRTQLNPPAPAVSARTGSESRAVGAVLAVGVLATLLLLSRGSGLLQSGIRAGGRRSG